MYSISRRLFEKIIGTGMIAAGLGLEFYGEPLETASDEEKLHELLRIISENPYESESLIDSYGLFLSMYVDGGGLKQHYNSKFYKLPYTTHTGFAQQLQLSNATGYILAEKLPNALPIGGIHFNQEYNAVSGIYKGERINTLDGQNIESDMSIEAVSKTLGLYDGVSSKSEIRISSVRRSLYTTLSTAQVQSSLAAGSADSIYHVDEFTVFTGKKENNVFKKSFRYSVSISPFLSPAVSLTTAVYTNEAGSVSNYATGVGPDLEKMHAFFQTETPTTKWLYDELLSRTVETGI